ncbi:Phospho-N-acetylmuramoyl-pentapeptide-transferase [Butyrivibrio fibrisolvens DSM 3071]|uniref:Phospho-N-acetylmuramoyl-pentapeptide-transferase n=1 Tax=Butyrivibrio fibrisolvens DSM 3071 TaxID=1121131 RepID=A0A1M5TUW7_BUTFI|nr:phospho-N-acetylmuramoyl-pentapeptide-transferase [Butyrivibrio fibrisolvens]SHH54203.1 Phospho-N-acetylmuramoyl-pentapeptide-transferase [Butyrivibrio fibrisolvens DSM 3071]
MTNEILFKYLVGPVLCAWILALIAGKIIIPILKSLGIKDSEREEGLESHKKKAGTPLMGGIIFLLPMLIVTIPYAIKTPKLWAVLILTFGFYIVGFIDDYIKVVMHRNLGLRVWQKLLLQFIVMVVFVFFVNAFIPDFYNMYIPIVGKEINLGLFNIPFLFLVALATTNGTNFTDGVDGLCGSVTAAVATFFIIVAMLTNCELSPVSAALLGGLLGYLYYNVYPGKVYMGDGGSLAIGGYVVAISYLTGLTLWIPIVGIIYAVEVISVVLQVGYFKITHGKRIFRMAPIHHHYEKGGWSETKVVNVFTTVTIIASLIGLMAIKW